MKKRFLILIFLMGTLILGARAQSISVQYGNPCVNGEMVYMLSGSSCSSFSWGVSNSTNNVDYQVIGPSGSNSQTYRIKWLTTRSNIYVYCNYTCGTNPPSSVYTSNFNVVTPVTPLVSLTTVQSAFCQGASQTLTATPTYGGATPQYTWILDGANVGSTTANTYTINTTSMTPGSHSIRVSMLSNFPCTDGSSPWSTLQNFTVNAKQNFTATLNGPINNCANTTTGTFVTIVNGATGTLTYEWFRNGFKIDQTVNNNMYNASISNGDVFYCKVSTTDCFNSPVQTNNFTVSLNQMITPTASINLTKLNYCTGESIPMSGSSPQGGSSYVWSLSGHGNFSTNGSTSLPAALDGNLPLAFNPGDVITLTVGGLSGSCLTSTSATTTLSASILSITQTVTPDVTLQVNNQSQNITICEGTNVQLTAIPVAQGTAPTYTFFVDNVQRQSGSATTYYTNSLSGGSHSAYVTMTSDAACRTKNSDDSNNFGFAINRPPVVSAGADFSVTLPQPSFTINGSASDPDGTTPTVYWTQYNYNGIPITLSGTTTPSLTVQGMESGTHEFRVTANDQCSTVGPDAVLVSVVYPANNLSYVIEEVVNVQGVTTATSVDVLDHIGKSKVINYVDGLGKPYQTVNHKASPNAKEDVIQPHKYDAFGREKRLYLPFVSGNTGSYKLNSEFINANGDYIGVAAAMYATGSDNKIADDLRPFSENTFEPSPLNRVTSVYGPGKKWFDDSKKQESLSLLNIHGTTAGQEKVIAWKVDDTGMPVRKTVDASTSDILTGGYYNTNTLSISSAKDESGFEVRQYTNKMGQMILKKVQAVSSASTANADHWAMTYYVYDDLGNLRYVFQPELSKTLHANDANVPSATELNNFAFQYKYNKEKLMVEKRVPGAAPVWMIYDLRDRLVFTQDGQQRVGKKWSFIIYDLLNRSVITGEYTHGTELTYQAMSDKLSTTLFSEKYNGGSTNHGYTSTVLIGNSNFVSTGFTVFTVTYYDNYLFKSLASSAFALGEADYKYDDIPCTTPAGTCQYNVSNASFPRVTGLVTGMKTNILGSANYLWAINYYDDWGRIAQVVSTNNKSGADRMTSRYDFRGKVLQTKMTHRAGSTITVVKKQFDYDHQGRLLKTYHQVDSRPSVILSALEYNELGQLTTKKLHASSEPLVDKQGTVYSPGVMEVSQYNNEPNLIAKDAVILKPGFTVTAGKKVTIRTVAPWTSTNNDPLPAAYGQVVDFRYNIRGWMTNINDVDVPANDYFSMKLNYHSTTSSTNDQYNGNIGQVIWATSGFDKQDYRYTYDPMNRLKEAKYYNLTNATKNDRFSETLLSTDGLTSAYDLNGNIKKLQRNGKLASGFGLMDNLTYLYANGNQVSQIDDAVAMNVQQGGFKESSTSDPTEYEYDSNGNMKIDDNKAIQKIRYNHLNLPWVVKKSATDSIIYTYDASGRKLRQEVLGSQPKVTDYAGDFFYEGNALKFINHEEGRVISLAIPAYEYFLKDHLGNVRVTFATREEIEANVANYEPSNLSNEQNKFLRVTNARKVVSSLFDRTNGSASGYSQRLTGGTNEKYGYARSIAVMPGDVISAEVYAKYVDQTSSNWTAALSSLMSQVATAAPGVVVDGAAYSTSTSSFIFGGLNGTGTSTGAGPKAYLNWLVFDGDMALLDGGYTRLSATPKEAGQDVPHERLTSGNITITKPGFVYVYLSNEESTPLDVYFDDFKVDQTKSPIVQTEDYYPFGLTFNSFRRESALKQNYLYNGKEVQDELELGWSDYGTRMYLADIGRWGVVDPLSERMRRHSPYNYAFDNPVKYIDPDGNNPVLPFVPYFMTVAKVYLRTISFSKMAVEYKLDRTLSQIDAVREDIQEIDDKIQSLRHPALKGTGNGGSWGGGSSSGGGAGTQFGPEMSKEESQKSQSQSEAKWRRENPEAAKKIDALKEKRTALQQKENALEKQREQLERAQEVLDEMDPVEQVKGQVFEEIHKAINGDEKKDKKSSGENKSKTDSPVVRDKDV